VKCNAAALLVVELVITSILSVLQVLNEVHHQFSAGMQVCKLPICSNFCNNLQSAFHESFSFFFGQTIAVIPVCPHGVLQLGSSLAVSPRYSVVSMC